MSAASGIELLRASLDERVREELRAFGVQEPESVVCAIRRDGAIAGVSSVFAANVQLIANRPFWIYRSRLTPGCEEREPELIKATFHALDAERAGRENSGEPMGLCMLLASGDRTRFSNAAEWEDPRMVFAGYLHDGRQVRIAYFSDEVYQVKPGEDGWKPPPGQRVELFAEQDDVTAEDVIELWIREGVLPREEAARRVSELLVLASDDAGEPTGILTAYRQRNPQLLADFWYVRTFVVPAHRISRLSVLMAVRARDHLEQRFTSGEDTSAIGVVSEIEYEPWKVLGGKGLWVPSDLLLIGENERGDHVRVHYFKGAEAPGPPRPATVSTGY